MFPERIPRSCPFWWVFTETEGLVDPPTLDEVGVAADWVGENGLELLQCWLNLKYEAWKTCLNDETRSKRVIVGIEPSEYPYQLPTALPDYTIKYQFDLLSHTNCKQFIHIYFNHYYVLINGPQCSLTTHNSPYVNQGVNFLNSPPSRIYTELLNLLSFFYKSVVF